MRTRRSFAAVLLVTLLLASGCGLLGTRSGDGGTSAAQQVEATIHLLAAAGESKDIETLKEHFAQTVVAQVLASGAIAPAAAQPLDQESLAALIESFWKERSVDQVAVSIANVRVNGETAEAEGSFVIQFTDALGLQSECAGTGSVTLLDQMGKWVLTRVSVTSVSCSLPLPGGGVEPPPGGAKPTAPQAYFDRCQYLVLGSGGEQVRFLQTVLNHLGYYNGRIDGDFGPVTDRAVRAFQQDHGLYVDGEAGPKTIAALDAVLAEAGGYYRCGVADTAPSAGETTVRQTALRAGTSYETPVYIYESPNPGPTLVFIGCIHGNERSGHLALREAMERGITISRGRLVIVPEFNRNGCEKNNRTYNGYDFNRLFPVGGTPTLAIAREMWDLVKSQPNLAFVVDFHDGFNDSLANTLIRTRQSEAKRVADKLRDELNKIRPSGAKGPKWRSLTEPISGSLTRKVGRDLGIPAMEVELAGRTNPDPLSLRKQYAWTVIKLLAKEYGIDVKF